MPISEFLRELRLKVGHDPILVPSVNAVIMDDEHRVLLMQSKDDGKWYLPGGAVDPGEQPADAIVREVFEETGLHVEPVRVIGAYSEQRVQYSNGDLVWPVTTAFVCAIKGGNLVANDGEAIDIRFFPVDALPPIPDSHRQRIDYALGGCERAQFLRG